MINVGDVVIVQQAYEDDQGNYHDLSATVLSIEADGHVDLEFRAPTEIREFLAGCEWTLDSLDTP